MIYYDLTFDTFIQNSHRIYRVMSTFTSPEGKHFNRGVSIPLGQNIRKGMAGIDKATTFYTTTIVKISPDQGRTTYRYTDDVLYTDASYFDFFSYDWMAGNPENILENPNEVVLTRSRTAKYFPGLTAGQAVGQTLVYNDSVLVKVVGVVQDLPERTDFNFNEFLSYNTSRALGRKSRVLTGSWTSTHSASQLFVLVHDRNQLPDIQQQLERLAWEHADEEMVSKGYLRQFELQPLNDLHFNRELGTFDNNQRIADKKVLLGLGCVALFLLLLGCINFINLNTAQAGKRAGEIGIRKTLGSSRKQLIGQFMVETALLTLGAALISLFLLPLLLRIFSDFIPEGIGPELLSNGVVIISILLLLVAVTFVAGFYPALVLTNFRPIKVLKNQIFQQDSKSTIRKYLTVFQFVIAQIFVIATLLVYKQVNYMLKKDMGFKTKATAFVRVWDDEDYQKRLKFVEGLKSIPQITDISLGGDPPASGNINSDIATFYRHGEEINTDLQLLFGDSHYRQLYGIDLLAGRDRLNDTIDEYVINETYSKLLGFNNPADAVGHTIRVGDADCQIVGVMADFFQRSLTSDITPMALVGDTHTEFYRQFNTVHFTLESQSPKAWPTAIESMNEIWKRLYPDSNMEVNFLDDIIAHFYDQETKTSKLLGWSMALSTLISCLGLLGLVIHTTERRILEIGIRKILGATVTQLNLLFCREFLILVGIAFAIAAPIAWLGVHNWLQDFAYKTTLSWWLFVLSGVAMMLLALVIISMRTMAAANRNPIKSLRTE